MLDEREARLPMWARDLISNLRLRLQSANEPLIQEVARLRPQVDRLKACNEALTELLDCAARGGHPVAQTIMEVLGSYGLDKAPE